MAKFVHYFIVNNFLIRPFAKPRCGINRFVIVALTLMVFGLSGCVYFNTYYNAEKAYSQAIRMRDKRLEKNPEDSIISSPEERVKLERCLTKSSKVLEIYSTEKKYQPKALFLIGEAYLAMGEYAKAILKYEELQRFYPNTEEIQVAEFHRAQCLFLNGQYPFARTALEKVLTTTKDAETRAVTLGLLAQLEVKNDSPAVALDLYEKLLLEKARTPEAKAHVHFEAAKLAWQLQQWERARNHVRGEEIRYLPTRLRYRCEMLAAECLFRLGRGQEGITELESMLKYRLFSPFFSEITLKLAEGYFQIGKPDKAIALLNEVPKLSPKSAYSAEAFYRLGMHQLNDLKKEKEAKVFFDSAEAAGSQFEYAIKGAERSKALLHLAELRKSTDTTAAPSHYKDFMIAELFLFSLDNVDSALGHLDRIVRDPRQDSNHSVRAAYARAFIQEEFKHSKSIGDSLYQFVLEKFPKTEYAKQAERNLGLKASVETEEDLAHKTFLEAEALRFGGGDLMASVIPAYAKVVAEHGNTKEAAKAQFTIAMLYDLNNRGEEKVTGSRDSAIAAYTLIRENYPRTPYFQVADNKLAAAGIKPRPKNIASSPGASANGKPGANGSATSVPGSANGESAAEGPGSKRHPENYGREEGDYGEGGGQSSSESTSPVDSSALIPEGKTKEVLDNGYDNVDQY